MESSLKSMKTRSIVKGEKPLVCIPIVGKSNADILKELANILDKKPDIIEWRADFYNGLTNRKQLFQLLSFIREKVEGIPILFTVRSEKEGGHPNHLTERGKVSLLAALCSRGLVDMIDYELQNDLFSIHYLRQVSLKYNVPMVLSYHNFHETPSREVLVELCLKMDRLDADFVKVAVMPNQMEDVLELLNAMSDVRKTINANLIAISMGSYGAITRLFGWIFGSAMTFGIGEQSSAPGQIPVEDVRKVIELTAKYM
ncbi:type I 3-dehydroquinate dehydratase [Halalkalibacterium halodurans]|uniref:3-dehydroquinate dehydratase n=1 Tax=Halalkalibacterium halodurans TaxID=86665 RepID=A0A0M0KDN4_ALKHA|nr:type I 3-dehydroquinate dehydratase [Halalkalibacterium halodurans]MDY7220924.1 type I 3-dehydroquinate dehydratase [Halalkalibacterium halodurans]MDY7240163.1 type I 3-dehydroquinate dehydratase [Halalkalibacterium halodurans]TPE69742.1 type I 3-dehydroquinate dehydratase [Halalkalibacterium halodurans]